MPKNYSSKETMLSPCVLDNACLLAIGRLTRATAEIEDLVTLYICTLADITMSKAIVLLGRTAITRRVEIAEYLASMRGPEALALHRECFNAGFWDLLDARNAIVHGVLIGRDDDGRYAFLTAKTMETEIPSAWQLVISFLPSDIEIYAKSAEDSIALLEKRLKLQPLRAERLARPLSPHRKSQPQRGKGAQPQRPPR